MLIGVLCASIYRASTFALSNRSPRNIFPTILNRRNTNIIITINSRIASIGPKSRIVPLCAPRYKRYRFYLSNGAGLYSTIHRARNGNLVPSKAAHFSCGKRPVCRCVKADAFDRCAIIGRVGLIGVSGRTPLSGITLFNYNIAANLKTIRGATGIRRNTIATIFKLKTVKLTIVRNLGGTGTGHVVTVSVGPSG